MRTRNSNAYGWESPEIIHKYSVIWHSRLNFILKELEFLKSLLKNNVFSIVESHLAKTAEDHLEELMNLQGEVSRLLKTMTLHKNGVKILFIKHAPSENEWNYKHEHRKLMIKMHEFDSDYQMLKKEIFKVIKTAIRHQKQKLIA
ncbi:hypothetical protein [Christiangramia sabulilitoris]|uniref:Uncharacterized protein n=1 Tax=Christiangramia sabulilitoris TaxID=2583991 RepID=A0A550I794_9FLAO|nr:hypothetical protein [Christiangramia sabulilitoris]TRO66847.1 hypothetical protein FGM01_02845 [Christiangramia sabulilitoris]